jgi:hypothetical protein
LEVLRRYEALAEMVTDKRSGLAVAVGVCVGVIVGVDVGVVVGVLVGVVVGLAVGVGAATHEQLAMLHVCPLRQLCATHLQLTQDAEEPSHSSPVAASTIPLPQQGERAAACKQVPAPSHAGAGSQGPVLAAASEQAFEVVSCTICAWQEPLVHPNVVVLHCST